MRSASWTVHGVRSPARRCTTEPGAGAATSPKYVVFQGDHVRWGQFQAQTVNYEGHESELGALVEPLKATKKVTLKAIPIG